MILSFYVPAMVAVVIGAVLTLRAFAAPRVPLHARAIVLVAWITSASIVALVPLDVWTTLATSSSSSSSSSGGSDGGGGGGGGGGKRRRQRLLLSFASSSSSSSSSPSSTLETLWALAYWTTQALTWCVIPLAQCASDAGDSTALKRLRTAAADCARFYSLVGAAVGAGVVALLAGGRLRWSDLPSLAVVLVNAYGLVAIVLLLGAGLVGIPRSLWRGADAKKAAARSYVRVGAAAARLSSAAEEARKVATVLAAASAAMPRRDPLREQMDRLWNIAEETAPFVPSRDAARAADDGGRGGGGGGVALDGLTDAELDAGADERSLADLGRRLARSTGTYDAVAAQYASSVRAAAQAEAVARARAAGEPSLLLSSSGGNGTSAVGAAALGRTFGQVASSSSPYSSSAHLSPLSSVAQRLPPGLKAALDAAWASYEVFVRPWTQRAAAALLAALSAALVWSEATLGTGASPDLSPFSRIVRRAAAAGGSGAATGTGAAAAGTAAADPFGAQMLVALPLLYMAAAVYRSLFGLGVFPFYRVVAGATEARSLLANAGQVSRFAAPLAYNYLHVLKLQGGSGSSGGSGSGSGSGGNSTTVFAKKMAASLRDVPVFGKSFNNWFPIVVAAHVALLLVDAWGRAARALPLPAKLKLLLAAAVASSEDDGDGDDDNGGGERLGGDFSASGSLLERGRALVRAELAAAASGGPLGAGLAAETAAAAGGTPSSSATMLPPPSPTGGGGGGGRGGGGAQRHSYSPARSETELSVPSFSSSSSSSNAGGIGGRLASAWGRVQQAAASGLGAARQGQGQQQQQHPPSASSRTAGGVTVGTARRLAGVSPLTRSLLSGRGGGGIGGGGGGAAAAASDSDRAALLGGGGGGSNAAPVASFAPPPPPPPSTQARGGGAGGVGVGGGGGGLDDLFTRLESGGGRQRGFDDDDDDLI